MTGIRNHDKKEVELNPVPIWLSKEYPNALHFFQIYNTYYILAKRDVVSNKYTSFQVKDEELFSIVIGSKERLEILKKKHDNTDCYVKQNIFDLL